MICIPFQVSAGEYSVFVALEDENLSRIREYDPAQLEPAKLGRPWDQMSLRTVLIGFATKDDIARTLSLCNSGKVQQALQQLSKGFQFRPDAGDYDGPYLSARGEASKA